MIYIGSDHAGFDMKEEVKRYLETKNVECQDLGTNSNESVDYPSYGFKVANKVAETNERGILVCGSGIGMSIVANRVKGVRAALCTDEFFAEMSRKHNDSNILVLAGRVTKLEQVKKIVDLWLNTKFEGDRHKKRIDMIDKCC